jgi:hypothetical protein
MDIDAPKNLDVMVLPSLMFTSRLALPALPAVYFVLDEANAIRYVGQTTCLKKRWNGPNKPFNPTFSARIAWLTMDNVEERRALERKLIRHFQPSHNRLGIFPIKPFVHLSIRVPKELYLALDLLSDAHVRTISQEVVAILQDAMKSQ